MTGAATIHNGDVLEYCSTFDGENARLREEVLRWRNAYDDSIANPEAIRQLLRAEKAEAENMRLRGVLESALILLEYGDFSNGVTDPTGMIDEGRVKAQEMIAEIRQGLL